LVDHRQDIPGGSGEVVLIPHAFEVLEQMAEGGVEVPGLGLAPLPVSIPVLHRPVLKVFSESAESERREQVVSTFTLSGIPLRSGVKLLTLAGVFHGFKLRQ
jgi:hypothetical protein